MSAASQADLLVRNIDWLITVDAGRRIIRDAGIAAKAGECITGRLDMNKVMKLQWPVE